MAEGAEKTASAALRAFGLLEHVARSAQPLSLAALAQAGKLPKPSALRIVQRLLAAGLLLREPGSKHYVSGPRLDALARQVLLNSPQRAARRRVLEALVDEIGETCNCTMLDGDQVIYLDRVEAAWPLRVHLQPGSRVPLHCCASGKLFLAHLRADTRRRLLHAAPLERYTANTVCDAAALERELRTIRQQGASFDREEYLPGIVCMAVPIKQGRRVIAAVALHAPLVRMSAQQAHGWLARMQQAAADLARCYAAPETDNAGY